MSSDASRSPGIPILANGLPTGFAAGAGVRGAEPDLDALVVDAAAALRSRYGMDVVIRFNSNGRSGGAWLATHAVDGIRANAEIGVRVALLPRMSQPEDPAARRAELAGEASRLARKVSDFMADPSSSRADIFPAKGELSDLRRKLAVLEATGTEREGDRLAVFAYVGTRSLASPGVATDITEDPDRRYACVEVASLDDAIEFLGRGAVLLDNYNAVENGAPAPRRG